MRLSQAAESTEKAKPIAPLTQAEAQRLADNVLRETSLVRGLAVRKKVACGVQSRAEIQDTLKKALKEQVSSPELAAASIYLKQLKLAPPDFNLPDYYVKMMDEQLAGYYDTKTNKFYTTTRVDRLQLQTVMAHELTHALQDQHFDLSRLEKWPRHDTDARLAMQALVEGDATLAMTHYTARNPLRSLALLGSALLSVNSSQTLLSGPAVLRESLSFPYLHGLQFNSYLYQLGGWPAINKAFRNLPASTEQILHPEKYIAGEKPVPVPFRDLSKRLGQGWKLLEHDVNGEWGLRLVLQEHLDSLESYNAAAGWAGDRYAIYQGPQGAYLITQVALWDSETDARDFAQAYLRHVATRTKTKSTPRNGALLWQNGPTSIYLKRHGKKVIALESRHLSKSLASLVTAL